MSIEPKREPGIHITQNNLRYLMNMFHDFDDHAADMVDDMVDFIMDNHRKYSLEKRSINLTNQTMAKKVLNKVSNDKTDVMLLSNLIFHTRKKLKHRGIKTIDNNSSEWATLKKLVPIVNEFCNDFELEKREGYIKYIEIGLSKISSFRAYITKLYDMSETISSTYESGLTLLNDENKNQTKEIHDYYVGLIVKRTGIYETFEDKPLKYAKFIEVGKYIKKLGVSYKVFIDAQFDGLAWTGGYPEPEQLVSDKSKERLNKYIYSSKIKNEKGHESKKIDSNLANVLQKIKGNGKNRT